MKKIGLLALAIVLSLGLVGAGFAYWNETLTIEGEAETGELDVVFVTYTGFETSPYVSLQPTRLLKVFWGGEKSHTWDLTGVYPSFGSGGLFSQHCFFMFYSMRNVGTIPAKVQSLDIDHPDWIQVETWGCSIPQEYKDELIAHIEASEDLTNEQKQGMIESLVSDIEVGDILMPGPWWKGNTYGWLGIELHILESASEFTTDTITITPVFTQFNDPGP